MSLKPLKTSGRIPLRRSPFSQPRIGLALGSNLTVGTSSAGGKIRWTWVFLMILVVLAGCSGANQISAGAPFYGGTFQASCSPVDAPGLLFELHRLGDPVPSQVSISVWRLDSNNPIQLTGGGAYGAAFIGGTEWIPAAEGVLTLEKYVKGEVASGWFWLELDGIDRIEGEFNVAWSDEGLPICG